MNKLEGAIDTAVGTIEEELEKRSALFDEIPGRIDMRIQESIAPALDDVEKKRSETVEAFERTGKELIALDKEIVDARDAVETGLGTTKLLYEDVPNNIAEIRKQELEPIRTAIDGFQRELDGPLSQGLNTIEANTATHVVRLAELDGRVTQALEDLDRMAAEKRTAAATTLDGALTDELALLSDSRRARASNLDDAANVLENRFGRLRGRAIVLDESAELAEVRFGSIETQLEAIQSARAELIDLDTRLVDVEGRLAPVEALIGNLQEESGPVVERIREAMALTSDEIAKSFIRTLDSDRWFVILGAVSGVLFLIAFWWISRIRKRLP